MAALVQKTAQFFFDGVTSTSRSITGVTAGNTLVATVAICSQPNTVPTAAIPTPSGWTAAVAPTGPTSVDSYKPSCAIFYKASAASGTHTLSLPTLPTDTYGEVTISEWSGLDASAPLDVTASSVVDSSGVGGGTVSAGAGTTAATSAAGGVLIVLGSTGGAGSLYLAPPNTGYTTIDTEPNPNTHLTYGSAYKLLSGSGTQTAGWTWSGNANHVGLQAAFKNASGGGGDVTLALTGVEGTGAAGTVAPATDRALTGNAGTGAVGTISSSRTRALTGNAATAAVGTVSPSTDFTLAGVQATGDVGTVSVAGSSDVVVALTGVEATGQAGDLIDEISVGLAGVEGTGQVGDLTDLISIGLSGVAAAGQVGDLVDGVSIGLSGVAGVGQAGTLTPSIDGGAGQDVTLALTGVSASGEVGSVTASGGDSTTLPHPGGSDIGGGDGRRYFRNFKPLAQRLREAREAKLEPVKAPPTRAARRAKAIEKEAAALAEQFPEDENLFAGLFERWAQETAGYAPFVPGQLDPMALFLAQVAYRQRQAEMQQIAEAMMRAQIEADDEAAIIALLLA